MNEKEPEMKWYHLTSHELDMLKVAHRDGLIPSSLVDLYPRGFLIDKDLLKVSEYGPDILAITDKGVALLEAYYEVRSDD